jgi:hypothetical protein
MLDWQRRIDGWANCGRRAFALALASAAVWRRRGLRAGLDDLRVTTNTYLPPPAHLQNSLSFNSLRSLSGHRHLCLLPTLQHQLA